MEYTGATAFIDIDRLPDGTADWKENFYKIYGAWTAARNYFSRRSTLDRRLIEALINERLVAKNEKDFIRADRIRNALSAADVEVTDVSGKTMWRIKFSTECGEVSK